MPTVAIDARDAREERPRGTGRYTRALLDAMSSHPALDGFSLRVLDEGGPGPEIAWEQLSLPRILRRGRVDVVHAPNCFLPLRRPCPGVVTVHDLAFEEHADDFSARTGWKYRTFARLAARSAERVICVSEYTRYDVCNRYDVDAERTRVIPNAPVLPLGSDEPPEGPYLLAVGDLRRKKNLVRLVRAFALLRREGIPHRLILAGADRGDGERVRTAALGLPVELTGWVSDARLDALIRGADLVVHPSLYEGFGLVVTEAMARGTPVAAARATALPETCGDAAVYFDPLDEQSIAAAIRSVLDDPAVRERLGAAGRERAGALSWADSAGATLGVYRELL